MKQYDLYSAVFYDTVKEYVDGIASKYGDKTAIVTYSRGGKEQKYTYRELREKVYLKANMLIKQGLDNKRIEQ